MGPLLTLRAEACFDVEQDDVAVGIPDQMWPQTSLC